MEPNKNNISNRMKMIDRIITAYKAKKLMLQAQQIQQDGTELEYIVKIKPKSQITKPQPPKTNSKKALKSYKFLAEQYVKNMDKYNAAKEFCDGRNYKFIVLTEDTILNGLR